MSFRNTFISFLALNVALSWCVPLAVCAEDEPATILQSIAPAVKVPNRLKAVPQSIAQKAVAPPEADAEEPAAQANPGEKAEEVVGAETHVDISPSVKEIAEELDVEPLLERLLMLKPRESMSDREAIERLTIKSDMTDRVLEAILEIHGVAARIDYEISQSNDLRNYLESKRDRAIKYNSIANIVSGVVVGTLGNALDLANTTSMENAGDIFELVGGVAQSAIGAVALKQQNGQSKEVAANPSMLSKILGRNPSTTTEYAEPIWRYLNNPPTIDAKPGETRRKRLLARWQTVGLLEGTNKRAATGRIDELTSNTSGRTRLSIDVLEDKAMMLNDLRAVVLQMERGLLELLRVIRKN